MMRLEVDLQSGPGIDKARHLVESLVGAHLSAHDEQELFHMVNIAFSELNEGDLDQKLRLLIHSTYYAQSLIVHLLTVCANHAEGVTHGTSAVFDDEQVSKGAPDGRLDVWDRVRSASVPL